MNLEKNSDPSDSSLSENKPFIDLEDHWASREIIALTKRQVIQSDEENLFHPETKITTDQFIMWAMRTHFENMRDADYFTYATDNGLIEDYDRVNLENPIERRQVARIVHDTLRSEFNEKDEPNWSAAKKLRDIYSCRTCVQHIAQVYVKGIMDPEQPDLFNVTGPLTRAQAAVIILRMIDKTERTRKADVIMLERVKIDPAQARELLLKDQRTLLFDVRSIEAYQEGHLAGSKALALEKITNNPSAVSPNKDTPIILYCQKGYRSSLAADLLVRAGYSRIYTIPGVSNFEYDLVR